MTAYSAAMLRTMERNIRRAEQKERRGKILRRIGIGFLAILIVGGSLAFLGIGQYFWPTM